MLKRPIGMPFSVPPYIEERIRAVPPDDVCVVPGSTPVVAFGKVSGAWIATLGLNPSKQEFLDPRGQELTGHRRRFETLASLGIEEHYSLTDEHVHQVFAACNTYFDRNPYRRWFDQLEAMLLPLGVSYYDGTVCHLDFVQWATDPTWGKLPREARQGLLNRDRQFLRQQLENESIRILLLNGASVIKEFQAAFNCQVDKHRVLEIGRQPTQIFTGRIFDRILTVGWSINLQSSFGVSNELRARLAETVAETCLMPR